MARISAQCGELQFQRPRNCKCIGVRTIATDIHIEFGLRNFGSFSINALERCVRALHTEGFVSFDGDVEAPDAKGTLTLHDPGEVTAYLNAAPPDGELGLFLEVRSGHSQAAPANGLSQLVAEIVAASEDCAQKDSKLTSASVYDAYLGQATLEFPDGTLYEWAGFRFSGDGLLDAVALRQALESRPFFERFVALLENAFACDIDFGVELVY